MAVKHSMLDPKMLELFDFAAANPMQGPLMTTQMMMPAVFLQMMERHELDMHRLDQMLAGDAEKAVQEQHEERVSAPLEHASEGEGLEQETEHTSFNLIYYNPETEEAQVIQESVEAKISDYAVKGKKAKAASAGTAAAPLRAADYMEASSAEGAQAPAGTQEAAPARKRESAIQGTASGASASAQSVFSPATQFAINSPAYLAAKTSMSVDQAVGQKSTYPLYTNVATPLAREVVDPIRLEMALKKIEVESPKPFGGQTGVAVAPMVFDKVEERIKHEGIEAEIVPVDTLHGVEVKAAGEHPEITALDALRKLEAMRVESLHQIDEQIKAFEHVIEELEVTDEPMEKLLELLPPLSRKRYLALLEHERKIAETLVVDMLIADLEFLVIVKEALGKKGLRGLVDTLKKLGKLPAPVVQKSGGGGDDDDEDVEVVPVREEGTGVEAKPARGRGKPESGGKGAGPGRKKGGAGAGKKKGKKKQGILGRALSRLSPKKKGKSRESKK